MQIYGSGQPYTIPIYILCTDTDLLRLPWTADSLPGSCLCAPPSWHPSCAHTQIGNLESGAATVEDVHKELEEMGVECTSAVACQPGQVCFTRDCMCYTRDCMCYTRNCVLHMRLYVLHT